MIFLSKKANKPGLIFTTMPRNRSALRKVLSLRKSFLPAALIVALATSLCACSKTETQPELSIAAAASLTIPLTKIGERFTSDTGIEVILTFASTGHLAQQIRNGAPYDIFAAADALHIDSLIDEGFLQASSRINFAEGRLVLIYLSENLEEAAAPADILQGDIQRLVIANPEHAPYGLAAKQYLINSGLWDSLEETMVFSETVRQATQVVSSGNAEAGIVAQSTIGDHDFRVVPIDQGYYDPILHVAAISESSHLQNEAASFLEYLCSSPSVEIFSDHGLVPVGSK